jgi:AcrR family transcriptional regulator
MRFIDTILEEAHRIFKKEGIETYSEDEIIKKLDIQPASYKEHFSSKADLLHKAVANELGERERAHKQVLDAITNPIEGIMFLLQDGIMYLKEMNPKYMIDMQVKYPHTWHIYQNHISIHYYHQISEILNAGVVKGSLRKDINIKLVSKIIIEQINLLFNPAIFPPDRYDLVEVFRSVFLYYLRGLCTEAGGKIAEDLFSRYKL